MDVLLSMLIIYGCCLALCFYLKLEWIHPAIIHVLIWFSAILLAYIYSEEKYFPKSYIMLFANLLFFLGAIIGGNLRNVNRVFREPNFNLSKLTCIIPFAFIALFYCLVLSKFGLSVILDTASFRNFLVADSGANYGLLGRLALLSLFTTCFLLLKNNKLFLSASIMCVPMAFLLGAKTLILFYLVTVLVLTPKHLKFSKVLLIGGTFVLCFILTMSMRNPDASLGMISYYFYNYLSGGILAFSQLHVSHTTDFGFYSLRNIYLWLNVFYPYPVADLIQDWVMVPFPTNVYTYLRPYYLDFGWLALIFTSIFGFVSGKLYSQKFTNVRTFYITYPIALYAILMQIFDDQYLTWLSNWILLVIIGFVMTERKK